MGSCKDRKKNFMLHKKQEILLPTKQLQATHAGLCTMELNMKDYCTKEFQNKAFYT
jgi:hypothetical protein